MFKRILVLLLLVSTFSFAQKNEKFFVQVKLKDQKVLNKLEQIKAPVLYISDENLLTKLTGSQIKTLQNLNAGISIIKKADENSKYFLKQNKLQVSDEEISIIENSSEEENIFITQNAIELTETPVTFKNEKVIQSNFKNLKTDAAAIAEIVNDIDADSVKWFIQKLQDFETRFLFAENRKEVSLWIMNQFKRMGFTDVVLDSFQYQNTWQYNVVATLKGNVNEDQIYIVGGHHDSYSSGNPYAIAPGADDNASGTTAALEVARVLMKNNYQPEATIKFMTFAAEEYGLHGSFDLAKKAYEKAENIRLMINHDMIAFTPYPDSQSAVAIYYYTGSENYRELAIKSTGENSILSPVWGDANSSGSDSYSYYRFGFPAVYFFEDIFSPFYHQPSDTIKNYNMEYCAEVIKGSCATLLNAIVIPDKIKNLKVADVGDGKSLAVTWDVSTDKDFDHYNLYVGETSGSYSDIRELNEGGFAMSVFEEGKTYYFGVSTVDKDGNESFIVERSGVPRTLPAAPKVILAKPLMNKVELNWNKNLELDFAGYNIYRSNSENESFEKINSELIQDTVFIDETMPHENFSYYKIESVDLDGNQNLTASFVRSRAVTLDQGILIVDETKDGSGAILDPTDEDVDEFYSTITKSFKTQVLDIATEKTLELSNLGAYSTVVWHGDDNSSAVSTEMTEALSEYLQFGGNLVYSGYRPTRALAKNSGLTAIFDSTHSMNKYFKVEKAEFSISSRFIGATSDPYNNIFADSNKTKADYNYHLSGIESISANDEAEEIFFFDTNFDINENAGKFKGKPVGIQYSGDDYKLVILSFPLYYMQKDESENFLNQILENFMNEVTPVEEKGISLPKEFALNQNYPNPFNPSTAISYQLSAQSKVELKIFDVLGREVQTLVNEIQNAGQYKVNFNASNLPSGIYIYQIKADNFIQSKKMMLVK